MMFAKAAMSLVALAATGVIADDIILKVTNLSFLQPFGPFVVITHNDEAPPLFTLGDPSSPELAILAEDGDPGPLVALYSALDGVGEAFGFADGVPFVGGESLEILIPRSPDYPYVTVASMAINTNDCFVAINGMDLQVGQVFTGPGYDSGSEENNENCNSIPGPACALIDPSNQDDGNGEGFVHVHRGFFGIGNDGLRADRYDWRNPMVRWEVKEAPRPDCEVEFILWDADSDVPLRPLTSVEYTQATRFNIEARPTVGCVTTLSARMMLTGPIPSFEDRRERAAPFMAFGNKDGMIFGQDYVEGYYTIAADIYSGSNFKGGIVVSGSFDFEIQIQFEAN